MVILYVCCHEFGLFSWLFSMYVVINLDDGSPIVVIFVSCDGSYYFCMNY
jgi:hypothetical protein